MVTTCVIPITPRPTGRAQRLYWHEHGRTLAAWLADMPSLMPADPDAPGDNVDRVCTQVSIGYRPTPHAVDFLTARGHIVRTRCGLFERRSGLVWTSRPVECFTCLRVLAAEREGAA